MRYSLYSIIFSFTQWLQIFWAPLYINPLESHLCQNPKWSQLEENQPQGKSYKNVPVILANFAIFSYSAIRIASPLLWKKCHRYSSHFVHFFPAKLWPSSFDSVSLQLLFHFKNTTRRLGNVRTHIRFWPRSSTFLTQLAAKWWRDRKLWKTYISFHKQWSTIMPPYRADERCS